MDLVGVADAADAEMASGNFLGEENQIIEDNYEKTAEVNEQAPSNFESNLNSITLHS